MNTRIQKVQADNEIKLDRLISECIPSRCNKNSAKKAEDFQDETKAAWYHALKPHSSCLSLPFLKGLKQ